MLGVSQRSRRLSIKCLCLLARGCIDNVVCKGIATFKTHRVPTLLGPNPHATPCKSEHYREPKNPLPAQDLRTPVTLSNHPPRTRKEVLDQWFSSPPVGSLEIGLD